MFKYDGWDGDYDFVQYYHVEFTEDVGVFKAGDCADCLSITQIHGKDDEKTEHGFYMLEQFSDNGDLIKSQKLKLSAVIEEK